MYNEREREREIYIYIYVYRERERDTYVYIYIYIYIYPDHAGFLAPRVFLRAPGAPATDRSGAGDDSLIWRALEF